MSPLVRPSHDHLLITGLAMVCYGIMHIAIEMTASLVWLDDVITCTYISSVAAEGPLSDSTLPSPHAVDVDRQAIVHIQTHCRKRHTRAAARRRAQELRLAL